MRSTITATAFAAVALLLGTGLGVAQGDERPTLTIGVAAIPTGLGPELNISNYGQRITASVYDKLIARAFWKGENGDGAELVPSIATEWRQVSPTEWEVAIRDDVVFHDGERMTAEDVAFSFSEERVWGEDRIVAEGRTYFGTFTGVSVVDDTTLRFTTAEPDPIFPARFTSPLGKVVPKDYYLEVGVDGFNLAPVGTGPYKVAEIRPDDYIRLVAHDEYWGGQPPAKEIIFREIPEEAARITGLINGELDMITNVSPDQKAVLENSEGVTLRSVVIDNSRIIALNTFEPPMDDVKLRQALVHAIDRETIVQALWQGETRVPHDLNFTSHGDDYLADRPMDAYDPEEAKRLLAESSYNGEPLIFRIYAGYYANYDQIAQVLQQQWREVGINVRLEARDTFPGVTEAPVHMFSHSNGMQIPDITHPMINLYGRQGIRTRPDATAFIWTPPERFFELIDLLETTIDREKRLEHFAEALDIVAEERPQIELFQAVEYYGVREGIDWKAYSFWPMDFSPVNLRFE